MVLGLKKNKSKKTSQEVYKEETTTPNKFFIEGGKKIKLVTLKICPVQGMFYQITPATTDGLFLLATTNCTFFTTAQQHFLPFPNSLWKMYIVLFILGLSLTKNLHVLTRSSKIIILGKSHWIASP